MIRQVLALMVLMTIVVLARPADVTGWRGTSWGQPVPALHQSSTDCDGYPFHVVYGSDSERNLNSVTLTLRDANRHAECFVAVRTRLEAELGPPDTAQTPLASDYTGTVLRWKFHSTTVELSDLITFAGRRLQLVYRLVSTPP